MKAKKSAHIKKSANTPLPEELFLLEESVGSFMEYWGFKKIHGRIWAHLYLSTHPLDTEELMRRLEVSKGLMSLAMRDLLHYEVIQQTATGKHGTVFYTANEDLQKVIFNVLKTRETKMLQTTKTLLEKLNKVKENDLQKYQLNRARIESALTLTTTASDVLGMFVGQDECEGPNIFSALSLKN